MALSNQDKQSLVDTVNQGLQAIRDSKTSWQRFEALYSNFGKPDDDPDEIALQGAFAGRPLPRTARDVRPQDLAALGLDQTEQLRAKFMVEILKAQQATANSGRGAREREREMGFEHEM